LEELSTVSDIRLVESESRIEIDGRFVDIRSFDPFFQELRRLGLHTGVEVRSKNSFPAAAGLASSSSGYAALALGIVKAAALELEPKQLSALARIGSGSAARAVYGGFTRLPAGAEYAERLYPAEYWPELRIGIGVVTDAKKETSSREGMNRSRETSPFYPAWIDSNRDLARDAEEALKARDLERLGTAMRQSYLQMFATMFSASPPFLYWRPESVAIIKALEKLRHEGYHVWETMDAGPQVKFIATERELPTILKRLADELPGVRWLSSRIGGEPQIEALAKTVSGTEESA
jgi:diphosphomevalonate decarboxylase